MQRPSQNPLVCFPLLSHCSTQAGSIPDKQAGWLACAVPFAKALIHTSSPNKAPHPCSHRAGEGTAEPEALWGLQLVLPPPLFLSANKTKAPQGYHSGILHVT